MLWGIQLLDGGNVFMRLSDVIKVLVETPSGDVMNSLMIIDYGLNEPIRCAVDCMAGNVVCNA